MIYRTRGIVFRTIKYAESSVITKIYTERFGMQSYIVNGVRSSKSRTKASLLQVLSLLEMEVYHHEHRNIHRIKEMQPFYVFSSLLFDPLKSSVALFMIEMLNKCIHEEEANAGMFLFISEKIQSLDRMKNIRSDFLLRFLLELSDLLGFHPNGEYSVSKSYFDLKEGNFTNENGIHPHVIQPPVSEHLSLLVKNNLVEISSDARSALLNSLLVYYQLHVPNFTMPRSLIVLNEVFRS